MVLPDVLQHQFVESPVQNGIVLYRITPGVVAQRKRLTLEDISSTKSEIVELRVWQYPASGRQRNLLYRYRHGHLFFEIFPKFPFEGILQTDRHPHEMFSMDVIGVIKTFGKDISSGGATRVANI